MVTVVVGHSDLMWLWASVAKTRFLAVSGLWALSNTKFQCMHQFLAKLAFAGGMSILFERLIDRIQPQFPARIRVKKF